MIVTLKTSNTPALGQIRAFLDGSRPFDPRIPGREQAYAFIADTLKGVGCHRLGKPGKGLVRRFLAKVCGLSRQQVTRPVAQHRSQGCLGDRRRKPPARPFARRYTPADILALAKLDALHGTPRGRPPRSLASAPSGSSAIRATSGWQPFPTATSTTSASPSPVCASGSPSARRGPPRPASASAASPGPRAGPASCAPTARQGDPGGIRGLCLINAIDEVTQFQFAAAAERTGERFLLPVPESLTLAFPFAIRGLHSDSGSGHINRRAAALLNKLHIQELRFE